MLYKNVNVIGFGSIIEEVDFNLDRPGMNIIRGPIGSGKTTILSTIYWAQYGLLLKEKSSINTWDSKKPEDYKGTKVELEFIKNKKTHKLIRCENYIDKVGKVKGGNNIFLYIDGELADIGKGKRTQQDYLNTYLGFSPDLFKNAVIFGQKLKRIIEETGPKKKQIFEEAFDVTYIQLAMELVKKELKKDKELYRDVESELRSIKSDIKTHRKLYKSQLKTESNFKKTKDNILDILSKDMHSLKEEQSKYIDDYKKFSKEKYESLWDDIEILQDFITNTNREIDSYNKDKKKLEKELEQLSKDRCYYCDRIMKASQVRQKKDSNAKEFDKINKKIEKLEAIDLKGKQKKIKKLSKKLRKMDKYKDAYERLKPIGEKITKKHEQFKIEKAKTLEIESPTTKSYLKDLFKDKRKYKKRVKKLDGIIEINEWLIKDPLSNNGIKTFILQELISKVNKILNTYSPSLGFRVTFEINMESSQKDFIQHIELHDGQVVDYYDLSGGQKQLVDMSVALAIHEVISDIKPTNILFMDEPFESLDADTVDIVSELIQSKPSEKSIFIITHQLSFQPRNSTTITVSRNEEGHSNFY